MKKVLVLGALFCGNAVFAVDFSMTTPQGKVFTLETSSDRVTGATKEFIVCGSQVDLVKKVKLWMPEHGHGSTPVVLGAPSEGCRLAQKVNFTMPGLWEVRVELSDGDLGVFELEVDRK